MPRHEQLSDDEIAVRSVLMRLHNSRQRGEAFYPAAFVNGHAPQMEADGWIERHGQGWRLTDEGLKVWARMNPELIAYKYQYGQHLFDDMRRVLRGEAEMAKCIVEGCENPRYVTASGEEHSRCRTHQLEKWRVEAGAKRTKKAAEPKEDGQPAEYWLGQMVVDPTTGEKVFARQQPTIEVLPMDEPVGHDCDTCEAKAIIAMLRARSPKLAALIDAMEQTQRTAADLGL